MVQTGEFHVFAIDLLGLGASEKPSPREVTYSIDTWASLVADFTQAMDTKQKWTFVGNSIGSLVSLATSDMLGQQHVRCCALMNCAGGMVSFRYSELNILQKLVYLLFNMIFFNNVVGKFLFNYIRKKTNLANILRQIYIDESAISNELLDILAAPAYDEGAGAVFLAIIRGDAGPKPEDLLKRLEWCPILALWGERDPWTPLNDGFHPGSKYKDYHNGLILQTIPNAGHCIHDEVPEIVNEALVPFLQSPRFRYSSSPPESGD